MRSILKVFKPTPFKLAVALTVLAALVYVQFGEQIRFLNILELKALDWRFRIRGPVPAVDDIVIVAIDDYSIDAIGRWPWPRSWHAELIDGLTADGAKVIGIDMILADPEESPEMSKLRMLRQYFNSLSIARASMEGVEFTDILGQAIETSNHDRILAASMARNNNVGIPLIFRAFKSKTPPPEAPPLTEQTVAEKPAAEGGDGPTPELPASSDPDEPPPELLADDGPETLPPLDSLTADSPAGQVSDEPPPELLADDGPKELPPLDSLTADIPEGQISDEPPPELLLDDGPGDLPPLDSLTADIPIEQLSDEPPADLLSDSGPGDLPPLDLLDDAAGSGVLDPMMQPELKGAVVQKAAQGQTGKSFDAPIAENVLLPLLEFSLNARSLGHVNIFPDIDGNVRWENIIIEYGGDYYPTFGVQLLSVYLNREVSVTPEKGLAIGDQKIPLNPDGRTLINYYGPAGSFIYVSYANVIEGLYPKDTFKDKIVLIGGAATGLGDVWTTPFSETMPGVEKHATVMANIVQNRFIRRDIMTLLLDVSYILLFGLAIAFVLPGVSAVYAVMITGAMLLTLVVSNYLFFAYARLWIHVAFPTLSFAAVAVSVILFKYFTEERGKKFLKSTFSSYLAPDLIDEMYRNQIKPGLGGEARNATAFFSDIESFSTFSEKLTAEQLVELLNEYLGAMTEILIAEKGTLDKYEGDAIVAFFGAPMDLPDHALRACRTAVAMQDKLAALRDKWCHEKRGPGEPDRNAKSLSPDEWTPGAKWPKLVHQMKMRIGINTGDIVVGNMGSAMRMNYTMMGDAVNLAARLEQAGKQYGVYTLASEYTLESRFTDEDGKTRTVTDRVEAQYVDTLTVKGRSEPTRVYELQAMKEETPDLEKGLYRR